MLEVSSVVSKGNRDIHPDPDQTGGTRTGGTKSNRHDLGMIPIQIFNYKPRLNLEIARIQNLFFVVEFKSIDIRYGAAPV